MSGAARQLWALVNKPATTSGGVPTGAAAPIYTCLGGAGQPNNRGRQHDTLFAEERPRLA